MTILKKADETKEQNSWKEQFLSIISSNHNYLRDLGVSIPEIE
jgi:mevalonate kinase